MGNLIRGPFTEPESDDDNGLDTGFRGRELWREGLSSKFKETKMIDLEELKRLLAKATPGPITPKEYAGGNWQCEYTNGEDSSLQSEADARLHAALRNAAHELIEYAERYRWLRSEITKPHQGTQGAFVEIGEWSYNLPEALDAAIDAARRKPKDDSPWDDVDTYGPST